ncbi:probable (S)-N-methylcoclaurine 3'-hydroxylase isozyme 2 [Rutidosis leptorrhynchoides]|uniref:probable (S)-N-methylcoclaurine 3'-hydroxylase isozyme 2 n=1 Tax=Rutidosis leptorrhynchoides TaxID=125765 RepID=UPI003A99C033
MDLKAFLTESFSSPLFIISTFIFLLFIIKQTKNLFVNKIQNLPPGPPKFPIIGNLLQVGDKVHESLAKFAEEYGPLISLQLGSQILVVASSPEAAMGILKTQDRFLSSRSVPTALDHKSLLSHSIFWSVCNETWRMLRTLCRTEFFSPQALETHSSLRIEKMDKMLSFLNSKQGEVINTQDIVFTTLFNTLSCIIFGKDLLDIEKENGTCTGLKASIFMILEYGARVKDFGSFFPIFNELDLQGIRKGGRKHIQEVFDYWKDIIDDRRRAHFKPTTLLSEQKTTFLDRLIDVGFTNDQINEYITELFVAGSNTTTTAVVWAMTELVKNKEVMIKIEEEMKREIETDKISESQLYKLPYLKACVKESFRLHAPVPFLLPRLANQTCEVMNYTIPKYARVFVNVWAMGRDPKVWDEPLCFKPERFIDSKTDFKGHNYELLPFGSGRRMCPGLPLGSLDLEFILASLIHEFDWVLPNNEDPMKIDMNDKFLLTLRKEKHLELIFKRKRGS